MTTTMTTKENVIEQLERDGFERPAELVGTCYDYWYRGDDVADVVAGECPSNASIDALPIFSAQISHDPRWLPFARHALAIRRNEPISAELAAACAVLGGEA
jgi:hypothetical protein